MEDEDFDEDFIDPGVRPAGERRAFRRGCWIGIAATLGGQFVLLVGGLLALGLLIQSGVVPDTVALPADEIPGHTLEFLVENGIVEEGESVHYFYGAGTFSLREDGNLFTDRRAIEYREESDALQVEQALYPEIAAIRPRYSGDSIEPTRVEIERHDGSSFHLIVSGEDDRDRAFVELLLRTWEAAR